MEKIIFGQLLELIPKRQFKLLSKKIKGKNKRSDSLSAWEQFICMSFAQITNCSGLRDIEASFETMSHKLYHVGIHKTVSRSNISRANNKRSSLVFKELAHLLIKQALKLYKGDIFEKDLKDAVYVLDSTYISLCLSLFPWAQVGKQNHAGIKIHTQLDLKGSIPTFIRVSKGSHPDNKVLDEIIIEPGAFYIMDKGYVDFTRLAKIDDAKGFFVVRFKTNIKFQRVSSNQVSGYVLLDQIGVLSGSQGKKKYQNKIRKVIFHDHIRNKTLVFMTNNFSVNSELIPSLYKHRWKIEIFFKWIKQNLRIKKFYGTSLNAIETQIWISISTYLLISIAKKRLNLQSPIAQILHILSFSLFEKELLFQILNKNVPAKTNLDTGKQLNLFNFR